jgi:hypothetical protein
MQEQKNSPEAKESHFFIEKYKKNDGKNKSFSSHNIRPFAAEGRNGVSLMTSSLQIPEMGQRKSYGEVRRVHSVKDSCKPIRQSHKVH